MRDITHDAFLAGGLIEPVERGGDDERRWIDCDLAALAEHRIGDDRDPLTLDPERRARWIATATAEWHDALEPAGSSYFEPYWLLEDGRRVGTIALSRTAYGVADMRVWSLYVLRSRRGLGTGRRALDRLREIAGAEKLGVRLDTCWSWQRTVRFYLRAGMWAQMWKHDLTLRWDARCPPRVIDVGPDEATLTVTHHGEPVVLSRARRRGDRLELDPTERALLGDEALGGAAHSAAPTLALAVALEGWPLIQSQEAWDQHHQADGGPPESLAYKISTWEAWDRHHGWRVETPRIPGLEYPSWEELSRRWEVEIAKLKAEYP